MTCIVGIEHDGQVWMGGDRAAVSDQHYLSHCAQPKVFRRGPFLVGYTSSFRMGQLLQYRLVAPDLPREVANLDEFMATTFVDAVRDCLRTGGWLRVENSREESGVFLVGACGRLYLFDDDYNVRRPLCGFESCGSGLSVALGSLYSTAALGMNPEDRINLALQAASQFVTSVRAPFDVISHEK